MPTPTLAPSAPSRKRPAGRPREFDRDAALSCALELFWRHGFEGTSTAMLTTAMGIVPPSLYAAFGSKEDLYRLAVRRYLSDFGGFLVDPLVAPGTAREAVGSVLVGAARQFSREGHAKGCMVSCAELQASPAGEAVVKEMAGLRAQAQHAIELRLDRGLDAGEMAPGTDTRTLAAFYAMVIQGMAVQARDGASEKMLHSLAMLAMKAWPTPQPAR